MPTSMSRDLFDLPLVIRHATGHSPAREIVQLLVSEHDLDHPDVHLLLQQVRGKAVAQRVHRDALVDFCDLSREVDSPVELTRA